MHALTGAVGIVAFAAGAVALISLLMNVLLALRLRRLRADQRLVLGEDREDLVAHAARLQREFQTLTDYLHDAAEHLNERMSTTEQRLREAIVYRALIRYDAYGEMSGRQSSSIALLDATRSGIVLSSIHHRDQSRLYAKQVHEGAAELELSPEEDEALRLALQGTTSSAR